MEAETTKTVRYAKLSRVIATLLLALPLVVSGCGGSSSSSEESAAQETSTEETLASDRCEPLPAAARQHLGYALDGKKLVGPVAVRSDDFEHVYFVAARVDGSPALWAMNRLDGNSLIFSINDHAYAVSRMGYGKDTDAHVTESDDGASEALSCV